jgi:hypothetical protein
MSIERWELGPELWATVATESSEPIRGVFGNSDDAWAFAKATEDGCQVVDEPTVMPCFVIDGEVVIANDYTVQTHEQLREAIAKDGG